jgi:hypothetical protein
MVLVRCSYFGRLSADLQTTERASPIVMDVVAATRARSAFSWPKRFPMLADGEQEAAMTGREETSWIAPN